MTALVPRRRPFAWLVGAAVLVALGIAVAVMLQRGVRPAARLVGDAKAGVVASESGTPVPVPGLQVGRPEPRVDTGFLGVRGIVRLPNGDPAEGASVSVWRATTAWPEWRRERLGDQAITGADGTFQFRLEDTRGVLVAFELPSLEGQYAGGLAEVPVRGELMDLRLQPGFELFGFVTTDAGSPVANARVALESVPGEERRVAVALTNAEGRYRFANVAGGPVRLVVRHDTWQPRILSPVVVGDLRRVDVKLDRPAMAPLRGRVTSAATFGPVAGAVVELLPINARLGLADPVTARTGADGTFVVAGLVRGNMRLVVRHPEHGFVMRTEAVGTSTAELQLELPRRTSVRGQVVAARGPSPLRGGEVLQIRDAGGQIDFVVVDGDGNFRCAQPLSPGWTNVRVVAGAFVFQRSLATELDVLLEESAENSLEFEVIRPNRVRGRLVDERGAPVVGAAIERTKPLPDADKFTDAASAPELTTFGSLSAIGSQFVQLFASDRDELLATTGPDGTFELVGVKRGASLLRMTQRGRGHLFRLVVVDGSALPQDLGEMVLPKGHRIRGQVMRGARPVAGATVVAMGGDHRQAQAVTDGSGNWTIDDLAAGEYRVRARLPTQPAGSPPHAVRVGDGQTQSDLRIVLESGRTVSGTVLGRNGQPIAGASVAVRGSRSMSTVSADDGTFLVELPERALELQVVAPDRVTSSVVTVRANQDRLEVRLDTPPVCTIQARLSGLPERRRLPSARLRFVPMLGDEDGDARTGWAEVSDGQLQARNCPAGPVRIEIWCDGFAPFAIRRDLAADEVHDLGEILLEPGARLSGRIVDSDGKPVDNANVMLGEESDLEAFEAGVRTTADGTFAIHGVCTRARWLLVRSTGYATKVVELALPETVLSPDLLEVRLERGATIEVAVAREARGAGFVQLRRAGRLVASTELDDQGKAWFANRSAGDYTVHVVGTDQPGRPAVVAAGMARVVVSVP
jgi:protocatechuate 3,4-dioxygenase beta subunit